jgi:hypothetical protein
MKKLKIKENKINNRFTDVAKVVVEVDGKIYRQLPVELASDAPDTAKAFLNTLKGQLKGKNWQCYISFLHY